MLHREYLNRETQSLLITAHNKWIRSKFVMTKIKDSGVVNVTARNKQIENEREGEKEMQWTSIYVNTMEEPERSI